MAKKTKISRTAAPYYYQTTDFTCGAASLLMAMRSLDKKSDMTRAHEMMVWREANTVFMGKGHPGTSPFGLALAAWRRGFAPRIWLGQKGPILMDYQTDKEKKRVARLMQAEDAKSAREIGIPIAVRSWKVADLAAELAAGRQPIVLVSTRAFHGDNTPHWVLVTGIDAKNVYVNDPWISRKKGQTPRSQTGRKIEHDGFMKMARYGKKNERAILLIGAQENQESEK